MLAHNTSNPQKLKVVLVQPFGFQVKNVVPLALAYLKSNLDTQICDVTILDCALEDIKANSPAFEELLIDTDADVVGVSTWSPMYDEALNVLRVAKKVLPKAITVIGGNHASTYHEEVMKNEEIDYLFRGEAEFAFAEFVRQIWQGALAPDSIAGLVYRDQDNALCGGAAVSWIEDIDSIVPPDYESINLATYIEKGYRFSTLSKSNAPIWLTRGCPYRCQFCQAPLLNGKKVRTHSVEYVTDLLQSLYNSGIRYFNIIDDNFTFHKSYAKDVCRAIVDLGLKDITMATPNGIRLQRGDPELWELMHKAGWKRVVIAPESGSPHTLALMKKDLDLDIVADVVRDMQRAGLLVFAFFIVGYPGERPEDLKLTRSFILKGGFDFFSFHVYQPLPGTPSFDEMVANGDLAPDFLPRDLLSSDAAIYSKELEGFNVKLYLAVTYLMAWAIAPFKFFNLCKKVGWRLPYTRFKELFVARKSPLSVPEGPNIKFE